MGMDDFDAQLFEAIDRRMAREATMEWLRVAALRSMLVGTGMALAALAALS